MTKMDGAAKEMQLFHGTPKMETVRCICNQNFDPRMHGVHGTLFGKGAYFSTSARYSHTYTTASNKGLRYIFYARVLVGSYVNGKSEYPRPPAIDPRQPHGPLFDSCVDNSDDPQIFVVFEMDQCYPEYLVEYQDLGLPFTAPGKPTHAASPATESEQHDLTSKIAQHSYSVKQTAQNSDSISSMAHNSNEMPQMAAYPYQMSKVVSNYPMTQVPSYPNQMSPMAQSQYPTQHMAQGQYSTQHMAQGQYPTQHMAQSQYPTQNMAPTQYPMPLMAPHQYQMPYMASNQYLMPHMAPHQYPSAPVTPFTYQTSQNSYSRPEPAPYPYPVYQTPPVVPVPSSNLVSPGVDAVREDQSTSSGISASGVLIGAAAGAAAAALAAAAVVAVTRSNKSKPSERRIKNPEQDDESCLLM